MAPRLRECCFLTSDSNFRNLGAIVKPMPVKEFQATAISLVQIRASSLSSVLCDNGDDLGRVTRDAFRVAAASSGTAEGGTMVRCEEVPRMALQPWFECDAGNEDERLVSRPRRHNRRTTPLP